jgi:hypothetical protein
MPGRSARRRDRPKALPWPARIAFNVSEEGSIVAGKILALQGERGFIRGMGGIGERRNLLGCRALIMFRQPSNHAPKPSVRGWF